MRKVVIVITVAVAVALAGMLPGKAEARCCNVAGIPMCGMVCWNKEHPTIPPSRNPARPTSGCCKQYGRWQCPCPH
jgi:hypothetical protein